MQLQSGVRVALFCADPSRDLGPHLSVSSGTECVQVPRLVKTKYRDGLYFPREDWQLPSPTEFERARASESADSLDLGETVVLFRLRVDLRRSFWDIDVPNFAVSPGRRPPPMSSAYRAFLVQVLEAISDIPVRFREAPSVTIVMTAAGLRSTTYDPEHKTHIGLHFDNFDHLPGNERSSSRTRISVNLGDEDRYLVFVNLTTLQLFRLLELPMTEQTFVRYTWASPLATEFMRKHPDYPVLRLRVPPLWGYIAPTQNIIHDGSTTGKQEPDINVLVKGRFNLGDHPA